MTERHAIVTGASGFLGRHLVNALIDHGYEVTALVRSSSRLLPDQIRQVVWDAVQRDHHSTSAKLGRFNVLINLAAYGVSPLDRNEDLLIDVNERLPPKLVEWAFRSEAVAINIGSCSEYAPSLAEHLSETDQLEQHLGYGRTKAIGGNNFVAAAKQFSVPAAHLRIFNMYGADEAPHRLTSTLIRNILSGTEVPLSTGNQVRDFIMVGDVCDAVLTTAEYLFSRRRMDSPAIWNVCTGRGNSVKEFALLAARSLGAPENILNFGALKTRKDETLRVVGNPSKIQSETGWCARVELEEGLRMIMNSGIGK